MDAAGHAWTDAYADLTRADRAAALEAADLERLATAAYMLGRDEDYFRALERAHQAYLDRGEGLRAARCGFWLGLGLMLQGGDRAGDGMDGARAAAGRARGARLRRTRLRRHVPRRRRGDRLVHPRVVAVVRRVHLDPEDLIDAGDRIVVPVHVRARAKNGATVDVHNVWIYEFTDGRLTRGRVYADTAVLRDGVAGG